MLNFLLVKLTVLWSQCWQHLICPWQVKSCGTPCHDPKLITGHQNEFVSKHSVGSHSTLRDQWPGSHSAQGVTHPSDTGLELSLRKLGVRCMVSWKQSCSVPSPTKSLRVKQVFQQNKHMLLTESNNVIESDHCGVQLKVKLSSQELMTALISSWLSQWRFLVFPCRSRVWKHLLWNACSLHVHVTHSFKRKSHSAIYMLNVYTWEVVNIPMHCSLIVVIK